ncbi:MAG: hypothetical protein AMXMBFR33_11570 [Candidatus Xenobia bacterium]
MRSRYSAYALGNVDYLMQTQVAQDRAGVERFARQARFTSLEVLEAVEDEVEFVASFTVGAERHRLHERSRFELREGRWIYVDSTTPRGSPVRREAGPARNDPCPCGSGKKYKKCCG